jgi:hypothetical protein
MMERWGLEGLQSFEHERIQDMAPERTVETEH